MRAATRILLFGRASVSAPFAPTLNTPTGGTGSIVLTWSSVTGATGYKLYRGTTPGGESGTPATGISSPYTDTGLSSGTQYYYTLKATNAGGDSAASNEVSAYTNSSLLTGLQTYYAFETLGLDSSGNGNTLTNTNSVTQTTGIIGQAGSFVRASSQYLTIASNSFLQVGGKDWTLAGWVKKTAISTNYELVSKGPQATTATEFSIYVFSDNKVYADVSNGVSVKELASSGTISTGAWHFVVVQFNSSTKVLSVAVDNGAATTLSTGITIQNGSNPFNIGASSVPDSFMGGQLDQWGLWSSSTGGGGVLTAAQLTSLYNSGAAVTYPFTGVP